MTLKILVDVNLSHAWVKTFREAGIEATHWQNIGDPRADDTVLMAWARDHGYAILTHDLDFSAILALTFATGPSVIQVRADDVLPDHLGPMLIEAIRAHESLLIQGAVVVVDELRARARILPLRGR